MIEPFRNSLKQNRLVDSGDRLLLAVSGGLDSVALLHLFKQVQDSLNLTLTVAHVHHGLRAAEGDADLDFVSELAARLDLPFHFRKVDVAAFAAAEKRSLEDGARVLRYAALEEMLAESGSAKIVTAHHANDQAETIIDRFLRGSGSLGLSGMPLARGRLIRPLLDFTRAELEAFVNSISLAYRTDSSNDDLRFKRNHIRQKVMPYLEENFNPDLVKTLCRVASIHEENEAFLQAYADDALREINLLQRKNEIILDIEPFLGYFRSIKKYILFSAFKRLGVPRRELDFGMLERLIRVIEQRKVGKRCEVAGTAELLLDHDGIVIRTRKSRRVEKTSIDLLDSDSKSFQEYKLSWSIEKRARDVQFINDTSTEFFDFEKTGEQILLRSPQPGDRFIPLNFKGHKKVADYFSDQKIPHHLRESTPVLESSNGIVWLCGFCIDDRFKVTNKTKKLLKLEFKPVLQ